MQKVQIEYSCVKKPCVHFTQSPRMMINSTDKKEGVVVSMMMILNMRTV